MWRKFEFASVTAVTVTLLFVVIGQSAQQLADRGGGAIVQADQVKPQFNAIDYSSTGAVGKTPVVIGPCDTHRP
jgi:hypothetical protein